MVNVHIQYFAILREQRGLSDEEIATESKSAAELYKELQQQHKFSLKPDAVKVAVNDELCAWNTPLKSGDRIVFVPPVAGG